MRVHNLTDEEHDMAQERPPSPFLHRILVGIDGSDDALRAAEFAAALAARLGAEVIGVHAMGLLEAWGDDESTADKHLPEARERARASMEGPWRQAFVDHGVAHRVELRDGNPVHVLLTAADELGADHLVVGSRGVGGLGERLMGSTSTQITERSAIPVVVVPGPHPGRAPEEWSAS
jgi:nucleotide-binding universal stress UspA family protein